MKIEKLKINLIDIGSVGGIEEPWQKKYIKNLILFEPNESALVKENIKNTLLQSMIKIKWKHFMYMGKVSLALH